MRKARLNLIRYVNICLYPDVIDLKKIFGCKLIGGRVPCFVVVNNENEIKLNSEWSPAVKFNSKNRLVDEKGYRVSTDYNGSQYRIIEKRERTFSSLERCGRGFLGTLAVICTLGLALFSKSVRNLLTKSKENIRFAVFVPNSNLSSSQRGHSPQQSTIPYVVSTASKNEQYNISEEQLQQGISISEETISKIQTCIKNENMLKCKEGDGVKFYQSQKGLQRVFALETDSELIFKMKARETYDIDKDYSIKERYQKMIDAQTVIRTYQLGLLVIPNAKLFTVNVDDEEYDIIAERKVDINPHTSAQEKYFQDHAESLEKAIQQLATFICKTGYSDVKWGNISVLKNGDSENGNKKIVLFDVQKTLGAGIGLFGDNMGSRGLVGCVTEKQGKMVAKIARENSIDTSLFSYAHGKRKQEIKEGLELEEYYRNKNIIFGNELLKVDENSMDFSEYPKKVEKLKEMTKNVVKAINDHISASSSEEPIKKRRLVLINTNLPPFFSISGIEMVDDELSPNSPSLQTNEQYYDATCIGYVVKKLVELGHIYKRININGRGCFLQA